MWQQDLRAHLSSCPARLLVCGAVSDQFEADVVLAGQNGRSADELRALVVDFGDDSDDSLSDDDAAGVGVSPAAARAAAAAEAAAAAAAAADSSDSSEDEGSRPARGGVTAITAVTGGTGGTGGLGVARGVGAAAAAAGPGGAVGSSRARRPGAPAAAALRGNAALPDPLAAAEEARLLSELSPEERFVHAVGVECKAARDKAIGSVPHHALALCFKVRCAFCVHVCVVVCFVCVYACVLAFVHMNSSEHAHWCSMYS
jgi:hypothetical protein